MASTKKTAKKRKNLLIFGGDGYLGWTLGLAFANRTDYNVVLLDNMVKRRWEKQTKAKSLVPFKKPSKRISAYKRIFGKTNLSFVKLDILKYKKVLKTIKKYKPAVIINAAQQPSAPFSMASPKNASATFHNNITGHLNLVWAIAESDKNIKYIKLGSAGCYLGVDADFIPFNKTDLSFIYKGKKKRVLNAWLPMYANDFYHQTKISDFLISELASEVWGLKIATIQQATIFGATIKENRSEKNKELATRFNYDAVFGTVINRFVCQLASSRPLTVYGNGKQRRWLISLSDTVENVIKITRLNIKPGRHFVAHNYTKTLSINEIAKLISEVAGQTDNIRLKNPRGETPGRLMQNLQMHKAIASSHKNNSKKIKKELAELISFTSRYKNNIDESCMMPKIFWKK